MCQRQIVKRIIVRLSDMNKLIASKIAGRAPLLAAVVVVGVSSALPGAAFAAPGARIIDEIVVTAPRLERVIDEMVVTAPRTRAPEVEFLDSIRDGVLRATALARGDTGERATPREIRLATADRPVDRG
jgi:hypothetical protein